MRVAEISDAVRRLRRDQFDARVTVVVDSVMGAEMVRRTLAVTDAAPLRSGGFGSAGVEVLRWSDLADRLVVTWSDDLVREATRAEVITLAVVPELQELDPSAPAWLRNSVGSPASWQRIAGALMRASLLTRSAEEPLRIADQPALDPLRELAEAVEGRLAAHGLVLAGRLLTRAATIVECSDRDDLVRTFGVVIPWMPTGAADGAAVLRLFSALCEAGVLTDADPADVAAPTSVAGRVVIAPDAHVEARVVADQVRRWLASSLTDQPSFDQIAVITPADSAYQGVVRAALESVDLPTWTSLPTRTMAPTPAGRLALAIARSLDRMPGCPSCTADLDGTSGHDCAGVYSEVEEVVHLVAPYDIDPNTGRPRSLGQHILGPARELNLTAGLKNWQRLLAWLAGEAELSAVTARNDVAGDDKRDRVPRVADDPELLAALAPTLALLRQVIAPAGAPTAVVMAERLAAVDQALRAAGRRQVGLTTLAERVGRSADTHVDSFEDLVTPAVTAPLGGLGRPGSGVAIVDINQVSQVAASHLAFCGLAEGLVPAPLRSDPLVDGDNIVAAAAGKRLHAQALAAVERSGHVLLTSPRVRIGTRAPEVASPWLLETARISSHGAAELMELTAGEAAEVVLTDGWTLEIIDSTLTGISALPLPGDITAPAPEAAAARYIERLEQWDNPEPTLLDGYLGTRGDGSWLEARKKPDVPISPSRVKGFVDCHKKFFLQTILGLSAAESPRLENAIPATTWGTTVHSAVQRAWPELKASRAEDRPDLLAQAIKTELAGRLPFLEEAGIERRIGYQVASVLGIIAEFLDTKPLPSRELAVEGTYIGVPIRGFIDFAWDDLVTDLKTGKKKIDPGNEGQVALYAEVLDAGKPAKEPRTAWEVWYASSSPKASDSGVIAMPDGSTIAADQISALAVALREGFFPGVGDPTNLRDTTCQYCDFTIICDPLTGPRWSAIQSSELAAATDPSPRPVQRPSEPADEIDADEDDAGTEQDA